MSLTTAGIAYIAVSYGMRAWHERLVERNLPKHVRERLVVKQEKRPTEIDVKINIKPMERGVTC